MQENQDEHAANVLVTIRQAADYLHVAESTVWRWIKKGLLPALRTPTGRLFVNQRDLEKTLTPTRRAELDESDPLGPLRKWAGPAPKRGVPPGVAIRKSEELMARIRARRGGEPMPDSVEDIRQMREERSREMDSW